MKLVVTCCFLSLFWVSCTHSDSTDYATVKPPVQTSKERYIQFSYTGNVFGVPPVYEGLQDTPKHRFEASGISASQFVKTAPGDTIKVTVPLCAPDTKMNARVVEDTTKQDAIAPLVTELLTLDGTLRYRVVIQ